MEASDLSSDEEEEPVRNSQMNRMLTGAGDAGVRRGRGLGQLANKFSALRTESEERPKLAEKTKKKKKPGTYCRPPANPPGSFLRIDIFHKP